MKKRIERIDRRKERNREKNEIIGKKWSRRKKDAEGYPKKNEDLRLYYKTWFTIDYLIILLESYSFNAYFYERTFY